MALVKVTRWDGEIPWIRWYVLDEGTLGQLDQYIKVGEAPESPELTRGLLSYHVGEFESALGIGPTPKSQRAREALVAGYVEERLSDAELQPDLELEYSWR